MGKLRRYCTALKRYRKSKGFGIHSPFAFSFVLNVLREQAAYYAYADIEARRDEARRVKRLLGVQKPKMISGKSARMMFRVANYFNPAKVLQLGSNFGVSAFSTLRVSRRSRMWLSGDGNGQNVALVLLQDLIDRIDVSHASTDAISDYEQALGGNRPYVVVNRVDGAEAEAVGKWLAALANREAVVVVRNLQRDDIIAGLWTRLLSSLTYGMTFSNGKMGIAVIERKLPRQNFQLWF